MMKTVEHWKWLIWNLQGTKMTKTRHRMSEEVAIARHPEAVRVPGTMELREICETEDDLLRQFNTLPRGQAH
jgi:hypothetical protein